MQFTKGKVANQRKLERSTQNLSKKRNQYKNASSRAWYASRQVKNASSQQVAQGDEYWPLDKHLNCKPAFTRK
jgi:hypothetical protein